MHTNVLAVLFWTCHVNTSHFPYPHKSIGKHAWEFEGLFTCIELNGYSCCRALLGDNVLVMLFQAFFHIAVSEIIFSKPPAIKLSMARRIFSQSSHSNERPDLLIAKQPFIWK